MKTLRQGDCSWTTRLDYQYCCWHSHAATSSLRAPGPNPGQSFNHTKTDYCQEMAYIARGVAQYVVSATRRQKCIQCTGPLQK